MYWLIKGIQDDPELQLQLLVTGMHLSPEFGLTYNNIEEDGFQIDKKVEILLSSDTGIGINKAMGLGMISFSEALEELSPDLVFVLGDRFEIFSVVSAAMIHRIPVAHAHGGEATEGLIDESIRHSITKMSLLHFTSTETYRNRVIQLGEEPNRVHNVGALGIENINRLQLLSKKELEKELDFKLGDKRILVTFHPVTLENSTAEVQFNELLKVLEQIEDVNVIFSKPNADTDGRIIVQLIDDFVQKHPNRSKAFVSLGQLRYLSALKHVDGVVGNSSSGLLEAPSFKTGTINIGDRQKGRIQAESVINAQPNYSSIFEAFETLFSNKFQEELGQVENPYGNNNPSSQIIGVLKEYDLEGALKKSFYDL